MIESKTKLTFESWVELSEKYKNDKKFQKMKHDKYRLLESMRSNNRTLANKKREEEIIERRKQRNLEKLN